jgi:hypothetical protein
VIAGAGAYSVDAFIAKRLEGGAAADEVPTHERQRRAA